MNSGEVFCRVPTKSHVALGHLLLADFADSIADAGNVHGRVENVATLAPGERQDHHFVAFGCITGGGGRTLARLVVGMGMDGHEPESAHVFVHLNFTSSRYRQSSIHTLCSARITPGLRRQTYRLPTNLPTARRDTSSIVPPESSWRSRDPFGSSVGRSQLLHDT